MFEDKELAAWLEEALRVISENGIEKLVIAGLNAEGCAMMNYLHCGLNDKLLIAGHIQADAAFDLACANADRIAEAIDELGEEDEEDV